MILGDNTTVQERMHIISPEGEEHEVMAIYPQYGCICTFTGEGFHLRECIIDTVSLLNFKKKGEKI